MNRGGFFSEIKHMRICQRATTIRRESDSLGGIQFKFLIQFMVIKPKSQVVATFTINKNLNHIALRQIKESRYSTAPTFFSTKNAHFEHRVILLLSIDLNHTCKRHIALV